MWRERNRPFPLLTVISINRDLLNGVPMRNRIKTSRSLKLLLEKQLEPRSAKLVRPDLTVPGGIPCCVHYIFVYRI